MTFSVGSLSAGASFNYRCKCRKRFFKARWNSWLLFTGSWYL